MRLKNPNKPWDVQFSLGMMFLVITLIFLMFDLYVLPHLIWNLQYDIPEFIFFWREWIKTHFELTEFRATLILVMLFILPTVLSGLMAYLFSKNLERKRSLRLVSKEEDVPPDITPVLFKWLFILILIFVGVFFLEWFIRHPF